MIYLIGGPPRCGKTTLAARLSHKLNVTWISGDTMEGVVRPYVCEQDYPKIFPKNILRNNTQNSNDQMYTKYSTREIMDSYIKQGEAPQYAIEVVIDNMLLSDQNLIIEGYHISPRFAHDMIGKYGKANVKVVFLVKTDAADALKTMLASNDKDDWVHNKTKDKEIIVTIAKFISEYSEYYVKGCEKFRIKCFDYPGTLEKHLDMAANYLLET